MKDKLFVVAIGGTGMRCLESFVHLCAIGMFDNQEIDILTLDTDQTNGNKARVESLIELYRKIKSESTDNIDGGKANANNFFSAKLNLYRFYTNYQGDRTSYKSLSKISGNDEDDENVMLSDLLLDKNTVQEFNLEHGYRAQTHLGSHLMYHAIIEAARESAKGDKNNQAFKDLRNFIGKLSRETDARIFVFGSVFGGTGASSIPIIPVAFRDATAIYSGGKESLDLNKIKFGSTLLTEYFSFKSPTENEMKNKENSVIADSSFFTINSQAALQFYQGDTTVMSVYKYMYHVGWPLTSEKLKGTDENKTITGGAEQKNGCHVVELVCACAAYDFFNKQKSELDRDEAEFVCHSAGFNDGKFDFSARDFVGNKSDVFMNKLGAFLSFAHIALSINKAARGDIGTKGLINRFSTEKIKDYDAITVQETKEIDDYFKAFAYHFVNNEFVSGWIYQIKDSLKSGRFIFADEAFKSIKKELDKIDVGKFFIDDNHNWEKSLISDRYDTFVKKSLKQGFPKEGQGSSTKEKFLAHIYNGITISQKFNN